MLQSFRIPRTALFNVLDGIHTQAAARTVPAEIKTAYDYNGEVHGRGPPEKGGPVLYAEKELALP